MQQELLPFRNTWVHPVFNVARFTRYFVLCLCFIHRGLSFWHLSFDHCVVCPSIYGFWLPLWYLQTLLTVYYMEDEDMIYTFICIHVHQINEVTSQSNWMTFPYYVSSQWNGHVVRFISILETHRLTFNSGEGDSVSDLLIRKGSSSYGYRIFGPRT
jgi:hypothetical protein